MSLDRPASVTVIAANTTDVVAISPTAGLRLLGYSIQEDAGTPAVAEAKLRFTASESQTVAITGSPTGGTFTLTFSGQTTAGIAFDATAAIVQAALEALSNIAPGDVTVTGGPLPATAVTVVFGGAYLHSDVAAITGSGASLTGGAGPAVSITQNGYTGTELVWISLAASAADTVWFGDRGIDISDGLFFERVSGTTVLALYTVTNN